jgi:4-amino-4-deoxy-L-arabinose transferase-like glycosyltransferase
MSVALRADGGNAERGTIERGDPRLAVTLWAAAVVFALSWFALLDSHALFNPDEGRYAEIPREMLASGNWLVPRLNDLVYIEKPPLQYWATAVSFRLFGQHDWSARLYGGLCGLLTVLAVAALARRLWGRRAAWRAGIMTGCSLLVVVMSHHLTLDMSLTFFTTLTLVGFCFAQLERATPARSRSWMWLAWVSAGFAVLTKGVVALVLPAATLAGYSLLQRDWGAWRRLFIPTGLALLLLITAPWFILIQHEVPQFFDFFFIREHLARYFTRVSDRYEPWWFFVPVLLAGSLPWLLPACRALFEGWRASAPRGEFDARRLLWVWAVVVLAFFSASDSKLVPYILPMFPALGLLMASAEEARLLRDLRATAKGLMVVAIALAALAAAAPFVQADAVRLALFMGMRLPLMIAAAVAAFAGITALRARGDAVLLTAIIGGASYVCVAMLLWGASAVEPIYSGASLAIQLPPALAQSAPIFSVRTYDQTLPFYLGRGVILVDFRNELDLGLTLEPHKAVTSLEEFEARWRASAQSLAVLEPPLYRELQAQDLPMVLRAQNPRRLIVSRR